MQGTCRKTIFSLGEAMMLMQHRIPLLLLLLTASCSRVNAPAAGPDPDATEQTRARIENRASVDMDVYLIRNDGQRLRLGFVAGGETSTFALPATLTAGAMSIRFEARPVRRSGQTVTSEPFGVSAGEEITWSISPQ
jgi:hypothetical protein